ncbi:MAG: hypothetical protein WB797_10730 [Nocardioides sp.]
MSTESGTHARWLLGRAVDDLEQTRCGPQRPLDHLQAARHAQERIHDAIGLLVLAARDEGRSWGQIGTALQITRQAARQAQLRRDRADQQRQEDRQWRMPTRRLPRRLEWFKSRRKAG